MSPLHGPKVHNLDTGEDFFFIHDAINDSDTLDGHTIFAEVGIYYENVVVNKTVNLIGEDKNTTIIDGESGDYAVNITSDWVNMSGFNIQNATYGIRLYYSNHSTISGNNASAHIMWGEGISLRYSNNNTIIDNNAAGNLGYGITLLYSNDNIVMGNNASEGYEAGILLGDSNYNTITGNSGGFRRGIWLSSSINNTISDNEFINNGYYGIHLESSSYNTFTGNNVSNSQTCNIVLSSSSNNIIYHNNFNIIMMSAFDDGDNIWDNGYPSGGNYWSDYTGSDIYYGPNQDILGADGIGDTPYPITGDSNQDNYPFMNPNGWEEPFVVNISIDIKPGDYPNSINPKSKGKVPVAILTTEDFDASEVDPHSIDFLDASSTMWSMDDVDNDGDVDLLLKFKTQECNFDLLVDEGDEFPYAYLNGETYSSGYFLGKDTVRLVGSNIKAYNPILQLLFRILERFPILNKILNQIISIN
jgi:parallel beta-helix repeat protein